MTRETTTNYPPHTHPGVLCDTGFCGIETKKVGSRYVETTGELVRVGLDGASQPMLRWVEECGCELTRDRSCLLRVCMDHLQNAGR